MIVRKIIGWAMIFVVFATIFGAIVWLEGLANALLMFGAAIVVLAFIVGGVWLITED